MTPAKWMLTEQEQQMYIRALTDELAPLRAKAGISQGDLSNMIGVSRQTYSAIECRRKEMSWSTYLSLILFFDYHVSTHETLRNLPAFPEKLINRMNEGRTLGANVLEGATGDLADILNRLDDRALHSIKTMLLVEYARCTNTPGDVVIKAFEGLDLTAAPPDAAAEMALKRIKNRRQ